MLQYAMDVLACVASDFFQVFVICNLIILVVYLVSSPETGRDAQHEPPRNTCLPAPFESRKSYDGDLPAERQFSISNEVPQGYSLAEVPQVQYPIAHEVSGDDAVCAYENNLRVSEAPQDGELLRIEGPSCYDCDTCSQDNSRETCDHEEEDEQFRKRVEAFISKVHDGLRAEMMQTVTQYAEARNWLECSLIESTS